MRRALPGLLLLACASEPVPDLGLGSTGGTTSTGGVAATGGAPGSTGGAQVDASPPSTGGTLATGGTTANGCPYIADCIGRPTCAAAIAGNCGPCGQGTYACGDRQGFFSTDGTEFPCTPATATTPLNCAGAANDANAHCTACLLRDP